MGDTPTHILITFISMHISVTNATAIILCYEHVVLASLACISLIPRPHPRGHRWAGYETKRGSTNEGLL